MSRRSFVRWVLISGAGIALFLVLGPVRQPVSPTAFSTQPSLRKSTAPSPAPSSLPPTSAPSRPPPPASVNLPFDPADFPIAARLNEPSSTVARDFDVLQQIFDAWRTNFPREGNPVGENTDITAALTGDNRLGLALVPKGHPALNTRGELCDRWGTPFRFHQLSGEHMEVRSAGPDRKFATADDAVWTPQ